MGKPRVLRSFAPDAVAAIRRLAAEADHAASGGIGVLTDLTWRGLDGRSPVQDHGLLVEADDGSAVAYAHVAGTPTEGWTIELLDLRGSEHAARELLAGALELVGEGGGGHATVWADTIRSRPDALTTVATAAGFDSERELLQLRVPLPVDGPRWPGGMLVRPFQVGHDEAAFVAVNNRAFAGHPEQGGWTELVVRARETEPWFDPSGFVLAFAADVLAGFCWTKVHPADPPREPAAMGEIYVIGVDPAFQGTGLGRALVAGGLQSLAERGLKLGMLYVDSANRAAVGLYHALGFQEHLRHVAFATTVRPR